MLVSNLCSGGDGLALYRYQVQCVACMTEQVTEKVEHRDEIYWVCVECEAVHETVMITRPLKDKRYHSSTWLRRQYEQYTIREIAQMCGVSDMTIFNWLKRHGIETRGRGRRPSW